MNPISQRNFSSIERMSDKLLQYKSNQPKVSNDNRVSFEEVLKQTKDNSIEEGLKFSKHANERLASRNIDLSQGQLERLMNGTKKAHEKGINESLVMIDNIAFIVNVKNNTVITAVNDKDDKVFTNIDGAVIM